MSEDGSFSRDGMCCALNTEVVVSDLDFSLLTFVIHISPSSALSEPYRSVNE